KIGQLSATGRCSPAATIGCCIGGGGGTDRRLEADDNARMMKMMTNKNGTQRKGANPKGKNIEELARENAITDTPTIATTTARTMPMTNVFGDEPRGAGAGNHPAGGGGGRATSPDCARLR